MKEWLVFFLIFVLVRGCPPDVNVEYCQSTNDLSSFNSTCEVFCIQLSTSPIPLVNNLWDLGNSSLFIESISPSPVTLEVTGPVVFSGDILSAITFTNINFELPAQQYIMSITVPNTIITGCQFEGLVNGALNIISTDLSMDTPIFRVKNVIFQTSRLVWNSENVEMNSFIGRSTGVVELQSGIFSCETGITLTASTILWKPSNSFSQTTVTAVNGITLTGDRTGSALIIHGDGQYDILFERFVNVDFYSQSDPLVQYMYTARDCGQVTYTITPLDQDNPRAPMMEFENVEMVHVTTSRTKFTAPGNGASVTYLSFVSSHGSIDLGTCNFDFEDAADHLLIASDSTVVLTCLVFEDSESEWMGNMNISSGSHVDVLLDSENENILLLDGFSFKVYNESSLRIIASEVLEIQNFAERNFTMLGPITIDAPSINFTSVFGSPISFLNPQLTFIANRNPSSGI